MSKIDELSRVLGRIEGAVTEIKSDIKLIRTDHAGLRSEFQVLEAGRLTRLESAFAVSEAKFHAKAKSTAILYASVLGIISSVVTAIIINFLVK